MAAERDNITMMLLLGLQPRRSMHKTISAAKVGREVLTRL